MVPTWKTFYFLSLNEASKKQRKKKKMLKLYIGNTGIRGGNSSVKPCYKCKGFPKPISGEGGHLPQLPRHSLNYNFYRKFYSTYNIFQQKGNIQEELAYTAATETKNTGKGWKISVICWFYFTALKTRHAAGISSKIKGRDWNKTTHNEYQHPWVTCSFTQQNVISSQQ